MHFGGSLKPVQITEHEFIVCQEIVLAESGILAISKYDAQKNQWRSKEINISDFRIKATKNIKGVSVHHFYKHNVTYDMKTGILYLLDKTSKVWSIEL